MAAKRKKEPDVFDEAIAAQAGSDTPTQDTPVTEEGKPPAGDVSRTDQPHVAALELNKERLTNRKHPNLNAIYIDEEAGIRLDREEKRMPGETAPRLLITFSEGKLPTKDETAILKEEGFQFNGKDKAWWKTSSPANQHIAKIVVNALLEGRGIEPKIAVAQR